MAHHWTAEENACLAQLWADGVPTIDIAKKLGVSMGMVQSHASDLHCRRSPEYLTEIRRFTAEKARKRADLTLLDRARQAPAEPPHATFATPPHAAIAAQIERRRQSRQQRMSEFLRDGRSVIVPVDPRLHHEVSA